MQEIQTTKKMRKKREIPNKKWKCDEVETLLDYLQQSEEIETPTAQIFYKNFLDKVGINATWQLVRCKVSHLKSSFKKAEDWRHATGAGVLESDGSASVEAKLSQMCPYYKQLNDIFGGKTCELAVEVMDSGEPYVYDDSAQQEVHFPDIPDFYEYEILNDSAVNTASQTAPPIVETLQTSSPVTKQASQFANKLKRHAPKSSINHLLQFQEDRKSMMEMKIEWEKEKHKREMEIEEKKIKLEEEKMKAEVEMSIRKIDTEEKLAILALEKEAKLAVLELKLKYHSQN